MSIKPPSTSRRKYAYHLESAFSPFKRTFSIRQGLIVPDGHCWGAPRKFKYE
jgi:hypothetical protein